MPRNSSRRQQASINITQKWNHSWPATWKIFTPFAIPTQANPAQYFLGYDTSSGWIIIAQVTNNAGLRVSLPTISPPVVLPPDMTHLQAFIGQPYLLYYKDGDSSPTFAEVVQGDKSKSLTIDRWPIVNLPPSDTLVPIMYQNQPWVMAYDGSQLALYQIDLAAKAATLRHTQDWGSGWTAFAPLAGRDDFVCLNATTRMLRGGQIEQQAGEPVVVISKLLEPLPQAWDALSSLAGTLGPTFLAYAQNGDANIIPQIYTLQWGPPLSLNPYLSDDWPLDTSSIIPFAFNSNETSSEYYLISRQMNTAAQGISSTLVTICSGVKPGYPET